MLRTATAALLCLSLAAPALAQPASWSADRGAEGERWRDHVEQGWSLGWYGFGLSPRYSHSRDEGYFSQSGREPSASNGHANFDYDRGYPYDHYSFGSVDEAPGSDYELAARVRECTTEWTRDRRSRQDVPVRVCRN